MVREEVGEASKLQLGNVDAGYEALLGQAVTVNQQDAQRWRAAVRRPEWHDGIEVHNIRLARDGQRGHEARDKGVAGDAEDEQRKAYLVYSNGADGKPYVRMAEGHDEAALLSFSMREKRPTQRPCQSR